MGKTKKLKKSQRKQSKFQCPPHMTPEEFKQHRKCKYSKEGRAMLKAVALAKRGHRYRKFKNRLAKQETVNPSANRVQADDGGQNDTEKGHTRTHPPSAARIAPTSSINEPIQGDTLASTLEEGAEHNAREALEPGNAPALEDTLAIGTEEGVERTIIPPEGTLLNTDRSKNKKTKKEKKAKPKSQIQLLGDKVAKKKAKANKQRDEDAKVKEKHHAKVAEKEKERKKEREKFFKKTKKGQPVMKHRIDKILGQLENEN